jgi:FlaA1/EpsC-like NDP-sugar epimerase
MNSRKQVLIYLASDFVSAALTWTALFVFRKRFLESEKYGYEIAIEFDSNYFLGLALVPVFWVALYTLGGMYTRILRRHRLKEIGQVITASAVGTIIIFFVLLLDDEIPNYRTYYKTVVLLFATHALLTLTGRLILTSRIVSRIHSGRIGFDTILVGGNSRALALFEEIRSMRSSPGYKFKGFVRVNGQDNLLSEHIPFLGKYTELPRLIREQSIEEVIVAVESGDHKDLENILALLEDQDVQVSIIPDTYDILSGSVKMTSVYGVPLIRVNHEIMPDWQFSIKRLMDIAGANPSHSGVSVYRHRNSHYVWWSDHLQPGAHREIRKTVYHLQIPHDGAQCGAGRAAAQFFGGQQSNAFRQAPSQDQNG